MPSLREVLERDHELRAAVANIQGHLSATAAGGAFASRCEDWDQANRDGNKAVLAAKIEAFLDNLLLRLHAQPPEKVALAAQNQKNPDYDLLHRLTQGDVPDVEIENRGLDPADARAEIGGMLEALYRFVHPDSLGLDPSNPRTLWLQEHANHEELEYLSPSYFLYDLEYFVSDLVATRVLLTGTGLPMRCSLQGLSVRDEEVEPICRPTI